MPIFSVGMKNTDRERPASIERCGRPDWSWFARAYGGMGHGPDPPYHEDEHDEEGHNDDGRPDCLVTLVHSHVHFHWPSHFRPLRPLRPPRLSSHPRRPRVGHRPT